MGNKEKANLKVCFRYYIIIVIFKSGTMNGFNEQTYYDQLPFHFWEFVEMQQFFFSTISICLR